MAASLTRPSSDPSKPETSQPWEQWAGSTTRPVELPKRGAKVEVRDGRRFITYPDETNGQKVIVGPMPSNALTNPCDQDRHDDCNHRLSAQCEGGIVLKLSLPGFLWRCGCPCHNDPIQAGRLF